MPIKKVEWVRIFSWLAVLLVMMQIFLFSTEPAAQSNHLSLGITTAIVKILQKIMPDTVWQAAALNGLIRKCAHFLAYLLLGGLTINAWRRNGVPAGRAWIFAMVICTLYAGSDEFHQLFVPGRSGELRDVLLDSSGALLGIYLYQLVSRSGTNFKAGAS